MSTPEFWREKLTQEADAVARLLQVDAQAYVVRAVRAAFVDHPEAGAEPGAAKATATEHGARAAAAVAASLAGTDWPAAVPADAAQPEDLPPLAAAALAVEAAAQAAITAAGLPGPAADHAPYALPRRFIGGDNLVSRVRELIRAAHGLRQHAAQAGAARAQADRAARGQAWDDA